MKKIQNICIFLLAGMGMILLTGCGHSNIVPVSGTVTIDGQPAANVRVSFQPVASGDDIEAAGPGALGITDANGHYEMEIVAASMEGKGATVGKNRVSLSPSGKSSGDSLPSLSTTPSVEIPKFPWGATKVETTIDIPAGGTTSADFSLPLSENEGSQTSI